MKIKYFNDTDTALVEFLRSQFATLKDEAERQGAGPSAEPVLSLPKSSG